jgi:RNA polymerase sigma factor (sigma-70 family)
MELVRGDRYTDWEAVYLDNVERVYRIMYAKVGNRQDAEDLTAEVFIAALGPLRLSASLGEVRAYLLATARTVLSSHWRRTLGREVTCILPEEVEDVVTGTSTPSSTAQVRVSRILRPLPPRYRRILQLRFLESRSLRETAAAMGTSIGNAKVLQHRALRAAAQLAAEEGTADA